VSPAHRAACIASEIILALGLDKYKSAAKSLAVAGRAPSLKPFTFEDLVAEEEKR